MDYDLTEITSHASWVMVIFLLGYLAIAIEQIVKFNKAATALIMAICCWTILFLEPYDTVDRHLFIFALQMYKVSQILFFLLGALTIVEIINVHKGFRLITEFLLIPSKKKMLWMLGIVTFFLSSVIDNLTTTIVMVSLIAKLVDNKEERMLLGGSIVVAANVGGAWTPIGDVATTLLWINGQVTTLPLIRDLFLPSILSLVVFLSMISFKLKGKFAQKTLSKEESRREPGELFILILGICALIFVPIFRVLTDLPAFMGMMLGLGVMWIVTDLMHYKYKERDHLRVVSILPKVDCSIIFFYLGILLSVSALESAGLLKNMAIWLDQHVSNTLFIPILVGIASSVVDNVSLVAGVIGMYDLKQFGVDSDFWLLLAYTAGTGGSNLIIGSAAGVALMALEKVDFMWYTRKISLYALLSFFSGIIFYLILSPFTKSLF